MIQKILLTFLVIHLLVYPLIGQHVVISEDLRSDTRVPKFGKNREHFGHFFLGLHRIAGEPELSSDKTEGWRSWVIEFGYRYKRRFSQVLSAGVELDAKKMIYSLKHWEMLQTPETSNADKHKLIFLQTGMGIYQRFNYEKRRGDYIGKYIDAGVYGDWNFNTRQIYSYRNDAGENVRARKGSLDYIRPVEWGILMRLGFNKVAVKATYRISPHFKQTSAIGELPKATIGVEFGLYPF